MIPTAAPAHRTMAEVLRDEQSQCLCALPYYGWAEALVRRVDPMWHAPEPPYMWTVHLDADDEDAACPTCGCTCGEYTATITKTVTVEAATEDEAMELAELEAGQIWTANYAELLKFPTASVPEQYLAWFEVAP